MASGLLDRYRVDDLLEHARSSEWCAAFGQQLDRPVTLTRVPLDGVAAAVERWRDLVRSLAAATRPGLAHVLDTFHADGADCVVSERLDGRPLAEVARL